MSFDLRKYARWVSVLGIAMIGYGCVVATDDKDETTVDSISTEDAGLSGDTLTPQDDSKVTGLDGGEALDRVIADACVEGASCQSDDPCSGPGTCVAGECIADNLCECLEDSDCPQPEDLCQGAFICTQDGDQRACELDPESVVLCEASTTPCRVNTCAPDTGSCAEIVVADGASCSDDDLCTTDDTCKEGVCTGGGALECSDGLFCNGLETCEATKGCVLGDPPGVDDGIECTVDSCDEDKGELSHIPQDSICDDDNLCTVNLCVAGIGCEASIINVSDDPCGANASCAGEGDSIACMCDAGFYSVGQDCLPSLSGTLTVDAPDIATQGACVHFSVSHVSDENQYGAGMSWPLKITTGDEAFALYTDWSCSEMVGGDLVPALIYDGSADYFTRAPISDFEISVTTGPLQSEALVTVAPTSYADDDRNSRALVVYNANADDAQALAQSYAEKRGVDASQLCAVHLPRGEYASPEELMSARDQILSGCLCALLDDAPDGCGPDTLADILEGTQITHLVLIRGIPPRLTGTSWGTDSWEPSFDYYLSYALAHDEDIFVEGSSGWVSVESLGSVNSGANTQVNPAVHGGFAYSRVEAYTYQRTLDLMDRTLSSEAHGLDGNVVSESKVTGSPSSDPVRFAVSNLASECTDYLSFEPFEFEAETSSWPWQQCRWGTTGSTAEGSRLGMMPGYSQTTIPWPIDVTWLVGTDAVLGKSYTNTHAAFYNYSVMKRWRKNGEDCTVECEGFATEEEVDACKATTFDYFKVLNSDCVGVAPGFMGQQLRSFPVQFYGFYPPGWGVSGGGNAEKSPPRLISTGGHGQIESDDSGYAHFGWATHEALNEDECMGEGGAIMPCPERVAVNMFRSQSQPDALPIDGARPVRLRFQYRNQGSPGAYLRLRVCINDCGGGGSVYYRMADDSWPDLDLSEDHLEWTEADYLIHVTDEAFSEITKVKLWFDGQFNKKIRGFFDLDSIELIDEITGEPLMTGDLMAFESDDWRANISGGFAATAIDRMGGIGFWGSSSHHHTGGYGYSPQKTASAVFAGHTLGDALFMTSAMSGIAYGDPLYRAFGAKIRTLNGDLLGIPGKHVFFPNTPEGSDSLVLDVLQGISAVESVRWQLDYCKGDTVAGCSGQWTRALDGVGAVHGYQLSFEKLVELLPNGEPLVLKLYLYRPDRPEDSLASYAFTSVYTENWVQPEGCQYDLDGDGDVDFADLGLIIPHGVCTQEELAFDLNGDDWVGVDDLLILVEAGDDPNYDFTGDGVTNMDDWNLLTEKYCGAPKAPANADVNGDGVLDSQDEEIVGSYSGTKGCNIPGS